MSGLKENFPKSEEIFKSIGRNSLEFIEFTFGPTVRKGLKDLRHFSVPKLYFEVFGKFYPSYDVLQPSINISEPNVNDAGTKAVYKITNSKFIAKSEKFSYHFYIIAGIVEALWIREMDKPVTCNIEKVHFSENNEDSFVELSIEFK